MPTIDFETSGLVTLLPKEWDDPVDANPEGVDRVAVAMGAYAPYI